MAEIGSTANILTEPPSSTSTRDDIGRDIINRGFEVIGLSHDRMEFIAACFDRVFKEDRCSRNGYVLIDGIVYAIGSRDFGNRGWREHAAQSTRETLDQWKKNRGKISEAFFRAFKQKNPSFPQHTQDQFKASYEKMVFFYSYFSAAVHQDSFSVLRTLQEGGDLRIRPGDDSDEKFVEQIKEFLYYFDDFFTKHAS